MSATPESVGMNGERLARIDRFLAERYVGPGRLPCAQLLVARDGQVVHQTLLGHADLKPTSIYLHLSERHIKAAGTPLDNMELSSPDQVKRSRRLHKK